MINPHPILPEFDYIRPTTAEQAVHFLQTHALQARPLLGGTDCLVAIRDRKITPKYLVDLKGLPGLNDLSFDEKEGLLVGAAVNLNRLIAHPAVQAHYPLITDAAREVGSYQLRTRATLAGNICNASPCGDTIAPCLAYQGIVTIQSAQGIRTEALFDFFLGPGKTRLEDGEIVTSIRLPLPPPSAMGKYCSIGRNKLGDLAIAAVTVLAYPQPSNPSGFQFLIVLSAVAPTVIFALEAQQVLSENSVNDERLEQAASLASQTCKPIDDIRASADYRREMVHILTLRALQQVWQQVKKGEAHGN